VSRLVTPLVIPEDVPPEGLLLEEVPPVEEGDEEDGDDEGDEDEVVLGTM
jgi:hypothetical protein